ncbi:MAG: hypothetical protein U1F52_11235 [Burkholderiales bacterium]
MLRSTGPARIAALSLVLVAGPAAAATPSFVCAKAKQWLEQTVCASPRLSELDLELAVVRARVLRASNTTARRALEKEHQGWWASLGECRTGSDAQACLAGRYQRRLEALKSRPDYPGEGTAKPVDPEPSAIAQAGKGWTKQLSAYLRALRACKEEAPVSIGKLLVGWPSGDGESVSLRLADWNLKEWICIAHRDGYKVFRFEPRGADERVPEAGPVYHLGGDAPPPGCSHATQVVDPNGRPAGWISEQDC